MVKKNINVLLIEDNPGDSYIIKEMLKDATDVIFNLEVVPRLELALKMISEAGYDVVLSDLSLPDSKGLETFYSVYARAPQIPIIVLSGLDDEDLAVSAVSNGAQDYLVKGNVDCNLLTRSIRYAIERKTVVEALRNSQKKLVRILESSPDAITVTDLSGNIIECNGASLEMLGFASKNELIGKNSFDFISPMDRENARYDLKERLMQGSLRNIEYKMISRDGKEFPSEISAGVIKDSKGHPSSLVIISKDITERKQTQAQLIQSEKLAGIGTLALGIAHEINNPLTGIIGYAEILMKTQNPDSTAQYAKMIMNQANRTADIVHWLSDYSRQAKITDTSKMNLNIVLKESFEALKHTRRSHNVKIITDYKKIPPIKGNKSEVQQVFVNLLNNAVDAMPNGGTLRISTAFDSNNVIVRISDSGIGIPKDQISRIFEPFFTTKEVGAGTGLGLYICTMIMKKHKGTISIESVVNLGTTFTLCFQPTEVVS